MVTFGEMRVRDVLIYCRIIASRITSKRMLTAGPMICGHHIEPKFTCTKRPARTGTNGDRLDFSQATALAT